jgi:hypothetical protein
MVYIIKNPELIDKLNPDPVFKSDFIKFLQAMKLAIQNIR